MVRSSSPENQQIDATVSFAHWWESGDGGDGLSALIDGFNEQSSGIDVEPTQATNLSLKIKTDILREQPMDVWTEWPGASTVPYRESGTLADLSAVWHDTCLEENCREGAKRAARDDGRYFTIPLNIHRSNNLFYDPQRLDAAGIDPTQISDPESFLDILAQIEDEVEVPLLLPMKNPWLALQMWETILLGSTSVSTYEEIINGNAARHERAIREALSLLDSYTNYTSDSSLFTSLTDANSRFRDGTGVFYAQGDWVVPGFTEAAGFELGERWDCVAFPGTEDAYVMVMDGLMVSNVAGDDDAVDEFVRYVASRDAQRRFNVRKGSLPPRTDVSVDGFSQFHKRQRQELSRVAHQPLSLTHGLAIEPVALIESKNAIATFLSEWDAEGCARSLVSALE